MSKRNLSLFIFVLGAMGFIDAAENGSPHSTNPYLPIEIARILPEAPPFFPTMLAQPHIIGYSVGHRCYDKVFKMSCIPISIGDQFSLIHFPLKGEADLFFGIEACVWAIFEARASSLSLINADYYVALPFTYIYNRFSARLRLFHESSHIGDEYLLEHPFFCRVNPSMEVLDLSLAWLLRPNFTLFAGYSRALRSDLSHQMGPNNFYYGFNYYLDYFHMNMCNVRATPYFATFFTNHQHHNWEPNISLSFGYEWNKCYGHKLRLCLEGHKGFSAEGQFSKKRTKYVEIKMLYGY